MSLLNRRRALISAKGKVLPYAYQQVEYLESTGTQYINIDRNVNNFEATVARTVYARQYIGCFIANIVQRCQIGIASNSINYGVGNDEFSSNYAALDIETDNNFHHYKIDATGLYMDGISLKTFNVELSTPNNKGVLFGRRDVRDTSTDKKDSGIMKIKKAKFFNYNTLVLDMVPCYRKKDGKTGMYDLVNGEFYTNQGTGEFIIGGEV